MLETNSRALPNRYAIALAILAAGFSSGASAALWPAESYLLAPGDFNGDGKDDLLVIAKDAALPSGIALNDGSGQPSVLHQSWASNYLGITWSGGTYVPHVGDFNGDNRDDVFLQRVSGGDHYVLLADADGKFTSRDQTIANSYLDINWSLAERRIVVGDFNNNGQDDLFLQSNSSSVDNVVALAGLGGSPFTAKSHYWPDSYLSLLWSLPKAIAYAGDFDANGYADLLLQAKPNWVMIPFDDLTIPIPTYRPESYGIVFPDATGKAHTVHDTWNHDNLGLEWSTLHYDIVVGNFDGTCGDDILLQAKSSSRPSYIVIPNCSAQIPTGSTVHTLSAGVNWDQTSYQMHVADFDGNGRSEIYMQAVSSGGTNRIAYTTSSGNVTSTPAAHTPSGNFKKPVAGTIPGAFGVGDQGAASYSMPIETPAGVGGLKPNLALVYNHMAGSGLAGMRWDLAGLSMITRCQTTFAQDTGIAAPVNNSSTDRFCLDGNRLVTGGTYGADGTEYKTEMETFQRIKQLGTQAGVGGPLSFRVDHRNGLSSYYGTTDASRVGSDSNVVRGWYLSYREDQFGNRINYTYSENTSTGETTLSEIAWTQNSATPTPKYKLTITYESRPDQRSGYDAGGAPWARTKRIDKIDVSYDSSTIRTYDLTYEAALSAGVGTGRSQLERVQVCGPDECLQPTVFATQDGTSGWQSPVTTSHAIGSTPLAGDWNGDGRADLFVSVGNEWQVYPGKTVGLFDSAVDTNISSTTNPTQARVFDFNGDGLADLLYQDGSSTWKVAPSNGGSTSSGFGSPVNTGVSTTGVSNPILQDHDGDGLADLVYQAGGINWHRNQGGSFASVSSLYTAEVAVQSYSVGNVDSAMRSLDANGDGRADLIVDVEDCVYNPMDPEDFYCTNNYLLLLSESGSFASIALALGLPDTSHLTNFRVGDFNGDGLDDVLFVNQDGTGWVLKISTGNGVVSGTATSIPVANANQALIADYDRDGRDDLIRPDGNTLYVYRSSGTTLSSSATELTSTGIGSAMAFVVDVTGSGYPQIVRTQGTVWSVHPHQGALADVVTTFTDGAGAAVTATYAPLTDSNVYTKNNVGSPPAYVRAYGGARYVVASEVHDNGIGGTRTFKHVYDTAYANIAGRGWLSFYQHRVDEVRNGTPTPPPGRRTVRTFNRDFPNAGLVTQQVVTLNTTAAEQIATTTNLLSTPTEAALSSPTRYFPRVEKTTSSDYGLGTTALRTAESDPTFDTSSGAVTTVTETMSQTAPTAQTWTSVTTYNPSNIITTTEYCLGLPGLVTTTNTLPDATSASRKLRYSFYEANCALYQTTDESDSATVKQLRTTHTYDAFGNLDVVAQDSVTASQQRSTDYTFDSDGQFPTVVTIGTVDLATTLAWNYSMGQRQSVTGPDGLTTSFTYDNFGRIKRETRPGGAYTDFTYDECFTCWPSNARFSARARGSDGSDNYQFVDELQRPVGESWTLPLGTSGRRETRYDAWGRVDEVSRPYVYYDPVYWVTYQYDELDRTTQEDAPVSEAQPTGATTSYQYFGRDVWVTDAESHLTKYENNALSQIAKVTDALNGTTVYAYKHFGELGKVTDAESLETTITYDLRGYKSSMGDPNMGTWDYEYNVYGELARQKSPITSTNACSGVSGVWTTCLAYDEGGRITSRKESEGTTTYSYHPTGVGAKGKPYQISASNYVEQYTYSATLGVPSQIRRTIDSTPYDFDLTFDAEGRVNVLTYPTSTGDRFAVDYDYDAFGHMNVVKDAATSATFYTLTEADALGREVRVDLGAYATGLDEYRIFDRASGFLRHIDTGPNLTSTIQDLEITYDEVGNVKTRINHLISKTETLGYDALSRLTSSQVNGQSAVSLTYSAAGRITSKSDNGGTYSYGGGCGGPYAVKSAGGQSYCYDDAGRMTAHGSDTFTWYTYDLPKKLAVGTETAEFFYGTGRQRYKQIQKTGSTTASTIYYVGTLFEQETASGTTTYRHHVSARDRVIATVSRVGTTSTVQYLHRDHQGSVVEVTNATGGHVQSLAFDAWGLRRNPATWAPLGSPFGGTEATERGYTGHEHLDRVELIHMNGRVQDPRLGRFISADPLVQAPYHSQSLNRYSYVWNNPLTLVDPSGFETEPCDEQPYLCEGQARNKWMCLWGVCLVDIMPVANVGDPTFVWDAPPNDSGSGDVPQGGQSGFLGIDWGLVRDSFRGMTADDWRGIPQEAVQGARDHSLAGQVFTDYLSPVGSAVDTGIPCSQGDRVACAMFAITVVTARGTNPAARGASLYGREIKLLDGFYQAEGSAFKFSKSYYEKLWTTGRPAPFLQAEEALATARTVTPDAIKPGFYRYVNDVVEMVYNPTTKEVWHLAPLPGK